MRALAAIFSWTKGRSAFSQKPSSGGVTFLEAIMIQYTGMRIEESTGKKVAARTLPGTSDHARFPRFLGSPIVVLASVAPVGAALAFPVDGLTISSNRGSAY